MRFICLLLVFLCLFSGCAAPEAEEVMATDTIPPTMEETVPSTTQPPDPIELLLTGMTAEEKVGQLFLARCPEEGALEDIGSYHLGGYILFDRDISGETPETLRKKLEDYQFTAKVPLLIAVDEEGGTVCRVSKHSPFRHSPFPSPRELYEMDGIPMVLSLEAEKAILLSSLGINVNLGPVCDVTTDPGAFLYDRSLGADPETCSAFAVGTAAVMAEYQVGTVLKHFPGYGNNADTHTGMAVDHRSFGELEANDLMPFRAGIRAGCGAIMVNHTIVTAFDDTAPASLSPAVHTYLRDDMGFEGVIMTDDLAMQAISDTYGTGEAAVLAVLAGNDLLCSTEYRAQYAAVLEAVQSGRISTELLDSAAYRVLKWKQQLGLIT